MGRAAKKQSFIPADPEGPPLTFAESVLQNVSIHNEKDLKLAYDRSHYPKKHQKTDYCLPEQDVLISRARKNQLRRNNNQT